MLNCWMMISQIHHVIHVFLLYQKVIVTELRWENCNIRVTPDLVAILKNIIKWRKCTQKNSRLSILHVDYL